MKFLRLSIVAVISLVAYSGFAVANTGAIANRTDVAGFVIAANGTLTATNEAGISRVLARRSQFYANEVLKTGKDSSAQLRFTDRALMTLRPESQLNIEEYHFGGAKDPENVSFMNLVSGGFRTISGSIGKADKSAYRINTPAASIGIRGTDYELIISLDGKVFAAVHDGGITLVNDIGDLDLGSDSDYLFAEVGAGQSPLGLSEMPEIFKVTNGQKKELSPEEKAKLAKKLEEGKDKIQALLANIGGESESGDDGALQKELFNNAIANDNEIDTRIDPDLLAQLRDNGRFAALINANELGSVVDGKSISVDGDQRLFLGENNALIRFSVNDESTENEPLNSGHENVQWGRWSQAVSITKNGEVTLANRDVVWMDADIYDEAAISEKSGTVTLESVNVSAGAFPDQLVQMDNSGEASGILNINLTDKTAEGSFQFNLAVGLEGEETTTVATEVKLKGDLLKADGSLNHQFGDGGTINGKAVSKDNVIATGALVKPATGSSNPAFAGYFVMRAQLPSELELGDGKVGVHGLYVFSDGGVAQVRPASPAPFL